MADQVKLYPCHDAASGERIADMFSHVIRRDVDRGVWLVWDDFRWEVRTDDAFVERYAKLAADQIVVEAAAITGDDDKRRNYLRWAQKSMSAGSIRAAVAMAKSVPRIQVRSEALDRATHLLNCRNGTIDLRSGALRPHDPNDLITKLVPVNFVPGTYAPLWQGLLRRSTQVDPTGDTARFIELVIGYMLFAGNPENKIFFLIGPGGTGKSQVVEIPMFVLGEDYAWAGKPSLLTKGKSDAHTEEVAVLEHKHYLVVNETDGAMTTDEAAMKTFTGSKRMPVRSLYGKQRMATVRATIMIATNEAPRIEKFDDAIARRLIIIPSGPPLGPMDKKDVHLADKILANEAEGVLASIVSGAVRWWGLSQQNSSGASGPSAAVFDSDLPAAVQIQTAGFAHDNDPVIEFVDEYLEFGEGFSELNRNIDDAYGRSRRTEHRVGKRKLYERIEQICIDRGAPVSRDVRAFKGLRLRFDVPSKLPFEP
jgi:putative DNA primase/helicase